MLKYIKTQMQEANTGVCLLPDSSQMDLGRDLSADC